MHLDVFKHCLNKTWCCELLNWLTSYVYINCFYPRRHNPPVSHKVCYKLREKTNHYIKPPSISTKYRVCAFLGSPSWSAWTPISTLILNSIKMIINAKLTMVGFKVKTNMANPILPTIQDLKTSNNAYGWQNLVPSKTCNVLNQ
jgi:hypothetical protein